jgi:hypothetical protein
VKQRRDAIIRSTLNFSLQFGQRSRGDEDVPSACRCHSKSFFDLRKSQTSQAAAPRQQGACNAFIANISYYSTMIMHNLAGEILLGISDVAA